jgi:hypothetical protein
MTSEQETLIKAAATKAALTLADAVRMERAGAQSAISTSDAR